MWLTLSLILGMAFMITVVCCQPMFEKGSLDRMIRHNFNDYIDSTLKYPVIFQKSGNTKSSIAAENDLEESNESGGIIYEIESEDVQDEEYDSPVSLIMGDGVGAKYDDIRKEMDDNDQKYIESFSKSFIKLKQNVIYTSEVYGWSLKRFLRKSRYFSCDLLSSLCTRKMQSHSSIINMNFSFLSAYISLNTLGRSFSLNNSVSLYTFFRSKLTLPLSFKTVLDQTLKRILIETLRIHKKTPKIIIILINI